jgi:hypothetical protein
MLLPSDPTTGWLRLPLQEPVRFDEWHPAGQLGRSGKLACRQINDLNHWINIILRLQ